MQEELLRQLLESNTKSHDHLVAKTDELLTNQHNMEKELHLLVTNQANVIEDITEIKANIKSLEDGRIQDLENRLKAIEEEKAKQKHFWEQVGKFGGGILVCIGIVTGFLKLIGIF